MRIMTCHIGRISPRRQALERRPLQTFQTICHQLSIVQIRLFVYMIIDQTVSYIFGRGNALLKSS